MSTYLQGVTDSASPMQLYKPDYSFLTQVYNTKQAEYDTGFNYVKSLYNSALNSDLTSEDNQKYRADVFKKIQNTLKDASTLDLSNPANIQYAQDALNPIVKDKELAYDMAVSSRHKNEMRKLEQVRTSLDPKISSQYNNYSKLAIQFATEDLRNAKRGDGSIMSVSPQQFIPYQDVVADLNKAYKDLGLKIQVEQVTGTGYIYKQTNGKMAYAPFTKWAMQAIGNKYDAQFQQQGYVEGEMMIRNAMQSGNLSRQDAINTFAPQITRQLLNEAIEKGTFSDSKIKEYDIAISKFREAHPKINPNSSEAKSLMEIVKNRKDYIDDLAATNAQVQALQENGDEYVKSNLYNILTNEVKKRTALTWAVNTADLTSQTEISPDTTWATKFTQANENARHKDNLMFKYKELEFNMKKEEAAQRLATLKLQYGENLENMPREVLAGTYESVENVPGVKILQNDLSNIQRSMVDKALSASDGLINFIYTAETKSKISPIINKIISIAQGQTNVKLTNEEIETFKKFGNDTGIRVFNPTNAIDAAYALRQMSFDVYGQSQKFIKTLKDSKQFGKLAPMLKTYESLRANFKQYSDAMDVLDKNYNNLAGEILDQYGNVKPMYAGVKQIGFTKQGVPMFDVSGLSTTLKETLGSLLDAKYKTKTRPTGSLIIAKNVQPEEYNQIFSFSSNYTDEEKNTLLKNLSSENIEKLYGKNIDVAFDPGKEEVIVTMKALPKETAATKIANLRNSYEFRIPYASIRNNPSVMKRFYKYLDDNSVTAGTTSSLKSLEVNPYASVTAPDEIKIAGLDYTVQGQRNRDGKYGIYIYGSYENPTNNKKEYFENFVQGAPGDNSMLEKTEDYINRIQEAYNSARTMHDQSFNDDRNNVDVDQLINSI